MKNEVQLDLFQNLEDEYSLLLKKMALLPLEAIAFSLLKRVVQNVRRAKVNLLVEQGWLTKKGDTYMLHDRVKAFILEHHHPTLEEMEKPITFFSKLLKSPDAITSSVVLEKYINYLNALDTVLNKLRSFNLTIIEFWNALAFVYQKNGFLDEALPYFVKVIKINEKLFEEECEFTIASYHNLASLYALMGEYEKAESVYVKVIELTKKVLGKEHLAMLTSMNNLAGVYHSMGAYSNAELLYVKLIEKSKKILGEEHSDTVIYCRNLEKLYALMERF